MTTNLFKHLPGGKISKGSTCPWNKQCYAACYHTGTDHKADFSCASARAYALLDKETDEELEQAHGKQIWKYWPKKDMRLEMVSIV